MPLLKDKKGLVLSVANDRSIAWHIANNAIQNGATVGFGYLPLEKMERRARKALEEMGAADAWLHPVDVSKDADIDAFFAAAKERFGTLDFVVHSLAFANKDYLQPGKFLQTTREVFTQALDVSAYSLIALARAAAPLMPAGGSIIAMTYLGAERAVPGYNVMGVAKAALEATVRYLAVEMGPQKIRVNALSAGPVRTLSAMAVGGIDKMFDLVGQRSPLQRNVEPDEVGKSGLYLLSDLSSGVTGETLYVDSGYHCVGL